MALNSSGDVVGLGVIRECIGRGLAIGPLYASDESVASDLLSALFEAVGELSRFSKVSVFPTESAHEATLRMLNAITNEKAETTGAYVVQFTKEVLQVPQKISTILEIRTSSGPV